MTAVPRGLDRASTHRRGLVERASNGIPHARNEAPSRRYAMSAFANPWAANDPALLPLRAGTGR